MRFVVAVAVIATVQAPAIVSGAAAPPVASDCFSDPSICGVKPFEECVECSAGSSVGCCVEPPAEIDCYAQVDGCGPDKWCQLTDRESWNDTDTATRGRCVGFQVECESCTSTFAEDNPPVIPGLGAFAFYSAQKAAEDSSRPLGTFLMRNTRCHPGQGLTCTGDLIPALPPTCVKLRQLQPGYDLPTRGNMLSWAKRMLRMGAMNRQGASGITPAQQLPQGFARAQVQAGANMILATLWNSEAWGTFVPLEVSSTYSELCCRWDNYSATLSPFQTARTGPSYRNPMMPHDPVKGNAPACVWCGFDGAYNDENPSIWSLIHALSFNLPATVTEEQFQVLQSLPLFLRQHLSCPLCRSHIQEHLIDLRIPTTRSGKEWAHFYWRAHNYVNEQSEVTRCGSMSCGWGVWATTPAYKCAGSYRYPWYMSFADATRQWRIQNASVTPTWW